MIDGQGRRRRKEDRELLLEFEERVKARTAELAERGQRRSFAPRYKYFIEISVFDNGIGIAEEDVPKLFQPFHQPESPYQKRFAGAGLGLSPARRLVELHGGSIRVETGKGLGSTFTFSIPQDIGRGSAGTDICL